MTDFISPAQQTTLLILAGLGLFSVLVWQGARLIRRWRGTASILKAREKSTGGQASSDLPGPWQSLRVDVDASNRVLNPRVFKRTRQLFLDHYASGRISPGLLAAEYGQDSFLRVVDEQGQPSGPDKAMVESFRKTAAAHGLFRGWFREDVIEEGLYAGLHTLLAARWLCHISGLRYAAVQILLDVPGQPGHILVRVLEPNRNVRDQHVLFDVPCAVPVENMETPEAALEMELQETCSLGFNDLSDLRLLVRYNSYGDEVENDNRCLVQVNEHRLLYRAVIKPESAAALRYSDGTRPGLAVVSVAALRETAHTSPERLTDALRDAVGYYG